MLMRLKIYQIDPEKDPERVRFLALKNVDKVNPSMYFKAFLGKAATK